MGVCVKCTAPAPTGYLCTGCLVGLRVELSDVAGLIPDNHGKGWLPSLPDELHTTMMRGDQLGDPTEGPLGGAEEAPLVFRAHAAESLWVLWNVLQRWAMSLGLYPQGLSPRALARWMVEHLELAGKHPEAAELADEVTDAIHQARRAIDRPSDDRIYLGKCGATIHWQHARSTQSALCTEEIYASGPWIDVVTCQNPMCQTVYRVLERQEWLREKAQQHRGTSSEIAGFLRLTGMSITSDQVRAYARSRHGRPPRIEPVGANDRGHALYLITDVLAAVRDRYQRRSNA